MSEIEIVNNICAYTIVKRTFSYTLAHSRSIGYSKKITFTHNKILLAVRILGLSESYTDKLVAVVALSLLARAHPFPASSAPLVCSSAILVTLFFKSTSGGPLRASREV
jgi:hypothetical protein